MMITFGDHQTELTPEGSVWFPDLKILCIADLHFEKDSFFSRMATFLPPYASLETFEKLEKIVIRLKPDIIVAAGDSFHDKGAASRMSVELVTRLNALVSSVSGWYWVAGNHDPHLAAHILGAAVPEFALQDIHFRHKATMESELEISGHYHPKMRVVTRGHRLSAPCFVRYKNKLILPSFGQFTGGLNVNSTAFLSVIPAEGRELFLVHSNSVYAC